MLLFFSFNKYECILYLCEHYMVLKLYLFILFSKEFPVHFSTQKIIKLHVADCPRNLEMLYEEKENSMSIYITF